MMPTVSRKETFPESCLTIRQRGNGYRLISEDGGIVGQLQELFEGSQVFRTLL